ncbi:Uncharacterized protein FI667_g5944, partial [Globisporangium splendens]
MDSDTVYAIQIDKREAYEGRRRRSASVPGGPAWETGLFGFGDASWMHCFLALVLPCAIASNIEAMIDRSSYGIGAFVMGIAFLGEIVCATQSYQDGQVDHTVWTREYSDETLPISMWSLAAVVCGIMYASGVFAFRNMTRHYYRIPGSCCLDVVTAVCCSPCSMAQLSRHFEIAGPSVYANEALDTLPAYEST